MVEANRGARIAFLILALTGGLTLLLSVQTWGSCPTTPCGGILMAISEYSGIDLGFGVVTGLAGLALASIGITGLIRFEIPALATAAVLCAAVIVAAAAASVVWMFVIPGDDKEFYWPPSTAILVGLVGVVALATRRASTCSPSWLMATTRAWLGSCSSWTPTR